jgi:hypothetical protein
MRQIDIYIYIYIYIYTHTYTYTYTEEPLEPETSDFHVHMVNANLKRHKSPVID